MNKKKTVAYFQRMSKAFLMPVALLSIASIMTGIASIFLWHDQLREMFPVLAHPVVQYFANLLNTCGNMVLNNLPILYCVSMAFAMVDEDKEYAAFGALVGYLSFLLSMSFMLNLNPALRDIMPGGTISSVLGIETVNTGILGAIIVGLLSAAIHNKTHKIKLPVAISFYGGVRFVAIATALFFLLFGQIVPYIWTPITNAINAVAHAVANTGIFGPFLYYFGERVLIPTGMHQIWNTVIRDTAVSGIYDFGGAVGVIEGARAAFPAYMSTGIIPEGTSLAEMVKFLRGGQISHMVFAMPAVAFAMYKCADPDKRNSVKPLLITAALTAVLSGISEPIEFAFLFASPLLYLIYSVFCGFAYMIPYVLGSTLGGTEGSIIGLVIFGFLRNDSTWWINVIVGIVLAVLMYITFRWFIMKFDVKTPGRGGDYDDTASMLEGIIDLDTTDPKAMKAQAIIKGLGGEANILVVDNCMSRLRVNVADMSLVDEGILKTTGCLGIVKPDDTNIQVVYGATVNIIRESVNKELKKLRK